jgi:hypothetical protein
MADLPTAPPTPALSPETVPPSTTTPLPSEPVAIVALQPTTGKWEGNFNQSGSNYPVILYIEEIYKSSFTGKLNWPTIGNIFTSIEGEYITDFGDAIEQSKWAFIGDFKAGKENGIWLKFTETHVIQGHGFIILNGWYYAHIRENGTIVGVWFRKDATQPGGEFTIEYGN